MSNSHYVAEIKVIRVDHERKEVRNGISSDKVSVRNVTEISRVVTKKKDLTDLLETVQKHISIIDDDGIDDPEISRASLKSGRDG